MTKQMDEFRQTISDLELQDLGFQGNNYTWSNGREGVDNIQVRLDRALANPLWQLWFPEAGVLHLLRFKSDHAPILLDCEALSKGGVRNPGNREKVFRFEKMWMEHDACGEIVAKAWDRGNTALNFSDRTLRCEAHLTSWDDKVFGSMGKRIAKLKKVLEVLQTSTQTAGVLRLIQEKSGELEELLKMEEIYWFQRSRALWLKDEDRNTPFFHKKASQRRRRNTIDRIRTDEGEWIEEEEEVGEDIRKILNTPLSLRNIDDKLIWNHTKTGHFSVRSAYHVAVNCFSKRGRDLPFSSTQRTPWKKLWTIKLYRKINHFMWRACNDALPSMQALQRWGMEVDPACLMNTDVGVFPDGSVGLNFIVCDDVGRALLAGMKRVLAPPDNGTLIEAMALRFEKPDKCLKGGFSGDVVTMLIVGDILDWVGPMDIGEFIFASRNANRVANCLAQWDPGLNSMYVWIDEIPPCCNSLLLDDVRREPLNLD
ncbi:hypothetical protein ACS0TY_016057 [Phlomoides rotata]